MLLFELDFEEVSKKKLRECWSQLCRIRCKREGERSGGGECLAVLSKRLADRRNEEDCLALEMCALLC